MPIFEYKCRAAGEKFEFYLRGSEAHLSSLRL